MYILGSYIEYFLKGSLYIFSFCYLSLVSRSFSFFFDTMRKRKSTENHQDINDETGYVTFYNHIIFILLSRIINNNKILGICIIEPKVNQKMTKKKRYINDNDHIDFDLNQYTSGNINIVKL
jgi:hypothetical protein